MKQPLEDDPQLALIDAVLDDLSLRSAMYVGRRRDEGGASTFVIQTGEEGRYRLNNPDLSSDASIEAVVAEAQTHLENIIGAPVPICPRHDHALVPRATNGTLTWVCPAGQWQCPLGDYEQLTWPQLDINSLAPILSRRLHRRGAFPTVRTISVHTTDGELVADFGVTAITDELRRTLTEVAAPLPMTTHDTPDTMIRVG
jgi:hypothetical protein